MIKASAMAALLGTALVTSVQAEEVTIASPMAAGSLHGGPLDMVAYWLDGPEGALELTATFRDRETDDEPMRIVMPMQDGDALTFGLPGYRGTNYNFARAGRAISISVDATPAQIASR